MPIAFVRDNLRPAPWEQLLHDCALPLPRVTYDPTCTASSISLPIHGMTTEVSALANMPWAKSTALCGAYGIHVGIAQKRRTCIDPGIKPSSPRLALVAPFRVTCAVSYIVAHWEHLCHLV